MDKLFNAMTREEKIYYEIRRNFERCGYLPFMMRKFEEYSLYADNLSFLRSEYIITFTDKDGKLLALKPDVTLSIVKNTKATKDRNEKLYYKENVYRLDKQSGEYKEINQLGLECIGRLDLCAVIEITELALSSLAAIDESYVLEISDMGIVTNLLKEYGVDESTAEELFDKIRKKSADGIVGVAKARNLEENVSKILCMLVECSGDYATALTLLKGLCGNARMTKIYDRLNGIYEAFKDTKYKDKLRLEFSMLNDIGYYNGIIMQGFVAGVPRAVLFGGQYDKLVGKFRKGLSAMGFAVYLDELQYSKGSVRNCDVDVLIVYGADTDMQKVSDTARSLRAAGKSVRLDIGEPEGLKYSEKIVL